MSLNTAHIVATIRDTIASHTASLTPVEKSQYIAAIVGASIGASLYMPSAPVDIPRNFFLANHSERASCILGCINETYPLNIDLALSIASNIFLARYRLVFEPGFCVHVLGHLAVCSDDVVPGAISEVLKKVGDVNDTMALVNVTRAITVALDSGD